MSCSARRLLEKCGVVELCMVVNIVSYVPALVYFVAGVERIFIALLFVLFNLVMKVVSWFCSTHARRLI